MKDKRTAMKSCSSKTYNLVCDGRLVFVCIKKKANGTYRCNSINIDNWLQCNRGRICVASIYGTKFEGDSNLIEYVFISN